MPDFLKTIEGKTNISKRSLVHCISLILIERNERFYNEVPVNLSKFINTLLKEEIKSTLSLTPKTGDIIDLLNDHLKNYPETIEKDDNGIYKENSVFYDTLFLPYVNVLQGLIELFPSIPTNVIVYWMFESLSKSNVNFLCNLNTIEAFRCFAEIIDNKILKKYHIFPNRKVEQEDKTIVLKILREKLEEGLNSAYLKDKRYPETFTRLLDLCNIVKPRLSPENRQHEIVFHGNADANYYLQKAFGLKNTDLGFDRLFRGGLLINPTNINETHSSIQEQEFKPLTGIIRGTYGSGKSLLGFSLALEVAKVGGIALMLTLEQDVLSILQAAEKFGWFQNSRDDLFRLSYDNNNLTSDTNNIQETSSIGYLLIENIRRLTKPDQPESEPFAILSKFIQALLNKKLINTSIVGPKIIILDSLNSIIPDDSNKEENTRDHVNRIYEIARQNGFACILTSEEFCLGKDTLQSEYFVADLVIRLRTCLHENEAYHQRFIEIEKARGQSHLRGSHAFYINPNSGFDFYPSTIAVHKQRRRRVSAIPLSLERTTTGVPSLDSMFYEGRGPCRGTKTAIMGPTGCGKTELSLISLLTDYYMPKEWLTDLKRISKPSENEKPKQEGVKKDDSIFSVKLLKNEKDSWKKWFIEELWSICENRTTRNNSLLFAFKDNEQSVKVMIDQGYVGSHFFEITGQKQEDKKNNFINYIFTLENNKNIRWEDANKYLKIESLETGYVSPQYLVNEIRNRFKKHGKNKIKIIRVAFDNLAHMEVTCPLIEADPGFVTAIVSILDSEDVTSTFVLSELADYKEARSMRIQAQIKDVCDNVILCERISHKGADLVGISIHKSLTLHHDPHIMELIRDNETGLSVKPTFDLLKDVRKGTPTTIPVRFILRTETPAQDRYNNHIIETVESVLCPKALRVDQNLLYINKGLQKSHLSTLEELQILQFDEYQIPKIKESLYPISWLKFPKGRKDDFFKSLISKVESNEMEKDENKTLGIPYLLNLSFLVYRKDFWYESLNDLNCWNTICEKLRKKNNDKNENAPRFFWFDFTRRSYENYNCLFLEIFFSLLKEAAIKDFWKIAEGDCYPKFFKNTFMQKSLDALCIMNELCASSPAQRDWEDFHKKRQGFDSNLNCPKEFQFKPVDPNAVISRHWFTTIYQMYAANEKINKDEYGIIPLPNNITTAGEWYWGIPSYSAGYNTGVEIIDMLTTEEGEINRLFLHLGLPTQKVLYGSDNNCQIPDSIPLEGFNWRNENGEFTDARMNDIADLYEDKKNEYKVIHRSALFCYPEISHQLGYYIKIAANLPVLNDDDRKQKMNGILKQIKTILDKRHKISDKSRCAECNEYRKKLYPF